jgi:hypothetical protein
MMTFTEEMFGKLLWKADVTISAGMKRRFDLSGDRAWAIVNVIRVLALPNAPDARAQRVVRVSNHDAECERAVF